MTDQQLLSDVQLDVLEPPDGGLLWPSGLWSAPEVLGYLNTRQARFLKESGLIVTRTALPAMASNALVPLPIDWIATVRCCWLDPTRHLLTRGSQWELDCLEPSWSAMTGTRRPRLWTDSEDHGQVLRLLPVPSMAGTIELTYIALPTEVTGLGMALTVPDDFSCYLRHGILADMLGKRGRGQDLHRAQYFEERFQEGVLIAKSLIGGVV